MESASSKECNIFILVLWYDCFRVQGRTHKHLGSELQHPVQHVMFGCHIEQKSSCLAREGAHAFVLRLVDVVVCADAVAIATTCVADAECAIPSLEDVCGAQCFKKEHDQ